MKKAVIISSVIIAVIAGGIFMMKQACDFENRYTPYSVAYATEGNEDKVYADYNNGILTISGLDGMPEYIMYLQICIIRQEVLHGQE